MILIFFVKCISKEKDRDELSITNLIKIESFDHKRKQYYQNGNLRYVMDTLDGRDFGNRYEFYESGILRQYSFQIDSVNASYVIEFDSLGGVTDVFGDPLVYRVFSSDRSDDSLYVKYYISDFSLSNPAKLFLSKDGEVFNQVTLSKDSTHSYIRTYEHWERISGISRFFLVARIEALSRGEKSVFLDTLDMTRR